MPVGIPSSSTSGRLYGKQAHVIMNELALPFYRVSQSNQKPTEINHIYNKGIGAGTPAGVLAHFDKKNKTEGYNK